MIINRSFGGQRFKVRLQRLRWLGGVSEGICERGPRHALFPRDGVQEREPPAKILRERSESKDRPGASGPDAERSQVRATGARNEILSERSTSKDLSRIASGWFLR